MHLAVTVVCGLSLTGLILLQAWLVARAVARAPARRRRDLGDVGGVVARRGGQLARAALAYGAETAAPQRGGGGSRSCAAAWWPT